MIMVWHTNQYQVSKVDKNTIDKNKKSETSFDFQHVKSLSTEAVINAPMEGSRNFLWLGNFDSWIEHESSDF